MILIDRTMYNQCRENSIIMLLSHLEIHKATVIVSFSEKCNTSPTSLFPLAYTDQRVKLLQLFWTFLVERYCQAIGLTNWVNDMVTTTHDNWPFKLCNFHGQPLEKYRNFDNNMVYSVQVDFVHCRKQKLLKHDKMLKIYTIA